MKKNYGQTILIRQRMIKVHQRELIISHIRQNYCVTCGQQWKRLDVSSSIVSSLKQESIFSSLEEYTSDDQEATQQHKSDSLIQAEMKKSGEFIKKLRKITKDSYGKKRKSPPLYDQLSDLSNRVANLDMEWNDFGTVLQTTVYLRKLLSIERNPPIDEVILSGAVPYLLQYLNLKQVQKFFNIGKLDGDSGKQSINYNDLDELQVEAAWAITNIVSGTPDHTRYVVELGCIPALINLLDSESDGLKEQCVWALGNISGDSAVMRDLALDNGALPKVLKMIESQPKLSLTRNLVWALSNLLRGKPIVPLEIVLTTLPVLLMSLDSQDEDVLTDACWAISHASDGCVNERIQAIIDSGITRRVIELLEYPLPAIQTTALSIVDNLVSGNDNQTSIVLNYGLLIKLRLLLEHPKKLIRKEVLLILVNIISSANQIQMVIDSDIIPKVIRIITSEDLEVTIEGYLVLSNLCKLGSKEQIKYAIEKGVVDLFCDGLKMKDDRVIHFALGGLKGVIFSAKELNMYESVIINVKEYGGLDKILELKNHEHEVIKEISTQILEYIDLI